MSDLVRVEPETEADNTYISVLSQERESLDNSFETALKTIDQLIEFYSLDPTEENNRERYVELIRNLSKDPSGLHEYSKDIYRSEKRFQTLYRKRLEELQKINQGSYEQVSKTFEALYDQNLLDSEIQSLEKNLDDLNPIELDSQEVLSLDLSQDQLLEMLKIEKTKRAKLSFLNERVYEPDIKKLEGSFEKWNERETDLKRFLTVDMEKINKQIQSVKKTESLQL